MRNSSATKEQILAAAEKVFTAKGYWGARMDEIAEEAHINKRMIYVYFGNKDALYIKILQTVYGRLAEVERGIDVNTSPDKAIENFITAYFEFAYNNISFVKLVMWENLNEAKFIDSADAGTIKNNSVKILKKILENGKQCGMFKKDTDDDEIIFAINMFVFSYFSNRYTMPKMIGIDLENKENLPKRAKMLTSMILSQIKE